MDIKINDFELQSLMLNHYQHYAHVNLLAGDKVVSQMSLGFSTADIAIEHEFIISEETQAKIDDLFNCLRADVEKAINKEFPKLEAPHD